MMEFLIDYKEVVKYNLLEGNKTTSQTFLGFPVIKSPNLNTERGKLKDVKGDSIELRPCIACNDGITNVDSIHHAVEECAV